MVASGITAVIKWNIEMFSGFLCVLFIAGNFFPLVISLGYIDAINNHQLFIKVRSDQIWDQGSGMGNHIAMGSTSAEATLSHPTSSIESCVCVTRYTGFHFLALLPVYTPLSYVCAAFISTYVIAIGIV